MRFVFLSIIFYLTLLILPTTIQAQVRVCNASSSYSSCDPETRDDCNNRVAVCHYQGTWSDGSGACSIARTTNLDPSPRQCRTTISVCYDSTVPPSYGVQNCLGRTINGTTYSSQSLGCEGGSVCTGKDANGCGQCEGYGMCICGSNNRWQDVACKPWDTPAYLGCGRSSNPCGARGVKEGDYCGDPPEVTISCTPRVKAGENFSVSWGTSNDPTSCNLTTSNATYSASTNGGSLNQNYGTPGNYPYSIQCSNAAGNSNTASCSTEVYSCGQCVPNNSNVSCRKLGEAIPGHYEGCPEVSCSAESSSNLPECTECTSTWGPCVNNTESRSCPLGTQTRPCGPVVQTPSCGLSVSCSGPTCTFTPSYSVNGVAVASYRMNIHPDVNNYGVQTGWRSNGPVTHTYEPGKAYTASVEMQKTDGSNYISCTGSSTIPPAPTPPPGQRNLKCNYCFNTTNGAESSYWYVPGDPLPGASCYLNHAANMNLTGSNYAPGKSCYKKGEPPREPIQQTIAGRIWMIDNPALIPADGSTRTVNAGYYTGSGGAPRLVTDTTELQKFLPLQIWLYNYRSTDMNPYIANRCRGGRVITDSGAPWNGVCSFEQPIPLNTNNGWEFRSSPDTWAYTFNGAEDEGWKNNEYLNISGYENWLLEEDMSLFIWSWPKGYKPVGYYSYQDWVRGMVDVCGNCRACSMDSDNNYTCNNNSCNCGEGYFCDGSCNGQPIGNFSCQRTLPTFHTFKKVESDPPGAGPYDRTAIVTPHEPVRGSINRMAKVPCGFGYNAGVPSGGEVIGGPASIYDIVFTKELQPPEDFTLNTNVTAACTGLRTAKVNLAWSISNHATSYEVYRGDTRIATTDKTYFEDTTVSTSTSYQYWIRAINTDGCLASDTARTASSPCTTVEANRKGATTESCVPDPPSASLISIAPSCQSENIPQITVRWTKAERATFYRVEKRTSPSATWAPVTTITVTNLAETNYEVTDAPVLKNSDYYYRVMACDNLGVGNTERCTPSLSTEASHTSFCDTTAPVNAIISPFPSSGACIVPNDVRAATDAKESRKWNKFQPFRLQIVENGAGVRDITITLQNNLTPNVTPDNPYSLTYSISNGKISYNPGGYYEVLTPAGMPSADLRYVTYPNNQFTMRIRSQDRNGDAPGASDNISIETIRDFFTDTSCNCPYLSTRQGDVHSNEKVNINCIDY